MRNFDAEISEDVHSGKIAMGNPPFESMYFLLKMVVFHCYVSLPEHNPLEI